MIKHLISVNNKCKGTRISKKYLSDTILKILNILDIQKPIEISLLITNDKEMKSLNKKYREINNTTDVLSFNLFPEPNKEPGSHFVLPPGKIQQTGEIVISGEQAQKQAQERGAGLKDELQVLIVHGILHILGYDHETAIERRTMLRKEKNLIAALK